MINPVWTFDTLVEWFYTLLEQEKAPGFLIGLSGTDSLVTFMAAAKACEKFGRPDRIMGVHFAPSEDFLYDHPEAEVHLWFQETLIPWLKNKFPKAEIIVDTSIDWRCDGLRWGYLMDLSVVSNDRKRIMRLPEEQYWVVGTRNRTEDVLLNYSNASKAVSLQPIIHLWKSEILQLSDYLGIPRIAIDKSCETDCICGRLALPARHIHEVDALLKIRNGEPVREYEMPGDLKQQLTKFIEAQITKNSFKKNIPYVPDRLVFEFESGTLDLKKFNHFGHLYIAFQYLRTFPFEVALERYGKYLKPTLQAAGQSHRFNLELTRKYFVHLDGIMKEYPTYDNFADLAESIPDVMRKITA